MPNKNPLYKIVRRAVVGMMSPRKRKLFRNRKNTECLKSLYPEKDCENNETDYYAGKIAMVLLILVIGGVISGLVLISEYCGTALIDGYQLKRTEAGGGAYDKMLQVKIDAMPDADIQITVDEKKRNKEQIRTMLYEIVDKMESYILGENTSLDEVRSDLMLIGEIEGTPVEIKWELDEYEVMNIDGTLRYEKIQEEGTLVKLTAILSYEDQSAVYMAYANVLPKLLSQKEKQLEDLKMEIQRLNEDTKYDELQKLPTVVNGLKIVWSEPAGKNAIYMLILSLVSGLLIYFAKDKELEQKIEKRNRQMQLDYSEIVSKMTLLMGAGMNIKGAWSKIVQDYLTKKSKDAAYIRYAYEEMKISYYEMQSGVSEIKAYERFGKRCKVPCYLKLSALLSQNLKKGAKGLTELLEAEVMEAFEDRKNLAKKQGEEAGTKLLIPMFLMLVLVMIIIIAPATMAMQI